eukprot:m.117127 g.117127  ORF g.117127 m.117127 type:complete len:53 (+) comp15536_c0_seq2:68-226(+)
MPCWLEKSEPNSHLDKMWQLPCVVNKLNAAGSFSSYSPGWHTTLMIPSDRRH